MNLKECYNLIGGDYNDVLKRLKDEKLIEKFVIKFLEDKSFFILNKYIEEKKYQRAFFQAHILKGISLNLGFSPLVKSSIKIIDALESNKNYNSNNINTLLEELKSSYDITVFAIKKFCCEQDATLAG